MVRVYSTKNVLEEAQERVSYIFDEFPNVVVGMSGGKDSTVVYELCLREAEKRGRLPLGVVFIDQEAEYQATEDYVKTVMYDKRVKPYWLQIPFKIFNATSNRKGKDWLWCWGEGEKWMREKDPISIKENIYGTERFGEMFDMFMEKTFKGEKACIVGGVRAEEAPARVLSLTTTAKYKHWTHAKRLSRKEEHYTMYPIYDWSYTDIWKYIHDNKVKYNKIYDGFYRYGVPIRNMRVSNLNHETAIHSLYPLQELEPKTWDKLVKRLNGVHSTKNMTKQESFQPPKELPFMFKDWKEYRDYLLENLIEDEAIQEKMRNKFKHLDKKYYGYTNIQRMYKVCISTILSNDYHFTKLRNFENSPDMIKVHRDRQRREKNGKRNRKYTGGKP